MFSGIVEELGTLQHKTEQNTGLRLTFQAKQVLEGTQIGDSIAVNGVCLTVVTLDPHSFQVEVVPESLKRSNLGALEVGMPVNLERALIPGRPVGGHYVQGHVDATAEVVDIQEQGNARNFKFRVAPEWMRYLIPKGYVALDGASLTLVDIQDQTFSITMIPHTQEMTVLGKQHIGYSANLEVDMMGKYVERLIGDRITQLEQRITQLERKD